MCWQSTYEYYTGFNPIDIAGLSERNTAKCSIPCLAQACKNINEFLFSWNLGWPMAITLKHDKRWGVHHDLVLDEA